MSYNPKKLSINQIWELYKTLKPGLETEETFLVDEIFSIMEKIDTVSFKNALRIMFGEDFKKDLSPVEFALMFTDGIKDTGILDFAHMMRGLNGSAR